MMVINCSASAARHLYKSYKKNQDEGFFEPSSTVVDTIQQRQLFINKNSGMQWVIHAIKLGCSTCLIAMEVNTRWAHVIHQVNKGDMDGFIQRLNERMVNGIEWLGQDYQLFKTAQMEKSISRYFRINKELRFYQQTDASVMAHISQVAAFYSQVWQDIGTFPDDEETALEFDLRLNEQWRCRKDEKYDLRADEKMLSLWCKTYMQQNEQWITDMLEKIRSQTQTALQEKLQTLAELREVLFPSAQHDKGSSTSSDNIFFLSKHREKNKK